MAAAVGQYTVFGFDSRIDWRPTVFVDGLPKNRVCSACGLVSAALALLPCNHPLCSRCYDGSGDGEHVLCPLDKDVGNPGDVIWSTLTKDNLLGRKIQCWNTSMGCGVVGAVCEVLDHFEECQYHAVTCTRCKQRMAYKELLGHLETNDCSIPEDNTASISHGIPGVTIAPFVDAVGELRTQLSSLQACFRETEERLTGQVQVFRERAAADMLVAESIQSMDNTLKESTNQSQVTAGRTAEELALIRSSSSDITNTLKELVILVNEMNASLRTFFPEQAREVSAGCRDLPTQLDILSASSKKEFEKNEKKLEELQKSLDRRGSHELDVKEGLKRSNERLSDEVCLDILSVLGKVARLVSKLPLCASEPLIWLVEKWSELKQEAESNGKVVALCEKPKYFYGYYIHPGVKFKRKNGDITLHLAYHVCKGGYDSLVTWPLQKLLRLHVLNEKGDEIAHQIFINSRRTPHKDKEKPTNDRNGALVSHQYIRIIDIEEKGCLKNDKVSVKFTVSEL